MHFIPLFVLFEANKRTIIMHQKLLDMNMFIYKKYRHG